MICVLRLIGATSISIFLGCSKPTAINLYRESLIESYSEKESPLEFEIGDNHYKITELPGESFPSISQKKSIEEPWERVLSGKDFGSFQSIGIGLFVPSITGTRFAFTTIPSFDGVWIKDRTNNDVKFISIPNVSGLVWHNNERDLFISQRTGDKTNKLYLSTSLDAPNIFLTANSTDDTLLIHPSTTSSGLFLETRSINQSEVKFLHYNSENYLKSLIKSDDSSKFFGVEDGNQITLIQTKLNGESILYICDIDCKVKPSILRELLIEDAILFKNEALLKYREHGQVRIGWYKFSSDNLVPVKLPFLNGSVSILKKTANKNRVTVEVSSWLHPKSSYEVNLNSTNIMPKNINRLDPSINPEDYIITEREVDNGDGILIPVSIIQPIKDRSQKSLILMAYGAYEESFDPYYSSRTLQLLKRGIGVGIAHIRGGAEKGRGWYEATTKGRKLIGVKDLVAVSKWIKSLGIQRLGLYGRSAGGLSVARAMSNEPSLFDAVVLEVPFVNIKDQLMNFPESRDNLEWGSLDEEEQAIRIDSYDPMQNINKANYPPIFISSHSEDKEVPEKFISLFYEKLKGLTTNELIYRQYSEASHQHFSSKSDSKFADAEISTFLIEHLSL